MMIQIETDQVDSVDDTPAAVADLDADAPGVSEDDDDMFSATPDEPSRQTVISRSAGFGMNVGEITVYASLEKQFITLPPKNFYIYYSEAKL